MLDEPWWAQLLPPAVLVSGGDDPALVGRVFDLPMASVEHRGSVIATANAVPAGEVAGRLRRAAGALGLDLTTVLIEVVDPLRVALDDADPVPVRWWGRDGRFWVDGSAGACGRAVAWAGGRWPDRHRAIAAADEDYLLLAEESLF